MITFLKDILKIKNNLDNRKKITSWLDKMGVSNYTINSDLTVDVDGYLDLSNKGLEEIPVNFANIKGDIDLRNNKLKTFLFIPKGTLKLENNPCTKIYGTPFIGGHFAEYFFYNSIHALATLEPNPKEKLERLKNERPERYRELIETYKKVEGIFKSS